MTFPLSLVVIDDAVIFRSELIAKHCSPSRQAGATWTAGIPLWAARRLPMAEGLLTGRVASHVIVLSVSARRLVGSLRERAQLNC